MLTINVGMTFQTLNKHKENGANFYRYHHRINDYQFVPATACSVERLFNVAGWILTVLQIGLAPILFEKLPFIKDAAVPYHLNRTIGRANFKCKKGLTQTIYK